MAGHAGAKFGVIRPPPGSYDAPQDLQVATGTATWISSHRGSRRRSSAALPEHCHSQGGPTADPISGRTDGHAANVGKLGTSLESSMKLPYVLVVIAFLPAGPAAHAALMVGNKAPDFSTEAALGGKAFRFQLADALARRPVVLYFFPKAFTSGCTIEAHAFAEATARFVAIAVVRGGRPKVLAVSASDVRIRWSRTGAADPKRAQPVDVPGSGVSLLLRGKARRA